VNAAPTRETYSELVQSGKSARLNGEVCRVVAQWAGERGRKARAEGTLEWYRRALLKARLLDSPTAAVPVAYRPGNPKGMFTGFQV